MNPNYVGSGKERKAGSSRGYPRAASPLCLSLTHSRIHTHTYAHTPPASPFHHKHQPATAAGRFIVLLLLLLLFGWFCPVRKHNAPPHPTLSSLRVPFHPVLRDTHRHPSFPVPRRRHRIILPRAHTHKYAHASVYVYNAIHTCTRTRYTLSTIRAGDIYALWLPPSYPRPVCSTRRPGRVRAMTLSGARS